MKPNIPSIGLDPANQDSLAGVLNFTLRKFLNQSIDDMLPAKVIAFDASPPASVQVQPLIKLVSTNGTLTSRGQIAKVPVLMIGAGGFLIYYNIKPGDLGFIKANDRDISLFVENLDEEAPASSRMHNFSDSVFIPAALANYTINPSDDGIVIQNLNGTSKVSVTNSKVTVSAPEVDIQSTSVININCPTQVTVNAPLLRVNGSITAAGPITPNVP